MFSANRSEENIKRNYSTPSKTFISPKISDYEIDEYGNVTLKPAKERYKNLVADKFREFMGEQKPTR